MNRLDVRSLSTAFATDDGVVHAVTDVSFAIGAGRTLALVGESGSGKSVTSLTVMRLLPRTGHARVSGRVSFVDRAGQTLDLLSLPERGMRAIRGNQIAMIFQEPMTSLNPVFPIGEQIAEVLRTRMYALHYGDAALAKDEYAQLAGGAAACVTCANQACLNACPASVPIAQFTRQTAALLA